MNWPARCFKFCGWYLFRLLSRGIGKLCLEICFEAKVVHFFFSIFCSHKASPIASVFWFPLKGRLMFGLAAEWCHDVMLLRTRCYLHRHVLLVLYVWYYCMHYCIQTFPNLPFPALTVSQLCWKPPTIAIKNVHIEKNPGNSDLIWVLPLCLHMYFCVWDYLLLPICICWAKWGNVDSQVIKMCLYTYRF